MAKTTRTSNQTNYGGGFGKTHIIHDNPKPQGSMPKSVQTPPPPKTKE